MLGDEENQEIFFCASSDADFVVVEGMMGQTMSQEQLA
jgi:hypothetical protein